MLTQDYTWFCRGRALARRLPLSSLMNCDQPFSTPYRNLYLTYDETKANIAGSSRVPCCSPHDRDSGRERVQWQRWRHRWLNRTPPSNCLHSFPPHSTATVPTARSPPATKTPP